MIFKSGYLENDLKSVKNKDWYHQRFDGCPMFLDLISEAELRKEARKMSGGEFTSHLVWFGDYSGDWYIDQNDISRISKLVTAIDSKKLMKKWKKDEDKFFAESNKLDKIDFRKLSDKELKKQFTNYVETYLKSVTSSSIIDGFALGTDELIQTEIRNFLKTIGKEEMQYQCFTTLTAPITQSFINEAEISLLRVADLVKNGKDYKKAIETHTKKYFWTKNNYNSAYVLTAEDFMKEIKAMIKGTGEQPSSRCASGLRRGEGVNFAEEIERIKSTPIKSKREKEELIKQINLPKYIRNLLTISEDFTYWQDERKKKTFLMTHYGFRFLQEISRRTGYETEELKYFVYPELVALLDGKKMVSRAEAQVRKRGCLFYHKGDKYEIITDAEAEKFKKEIFDKALNTEVNDFRGMPASRGRVRGRVKVVMSVKELDKVEQGDILVAVMTRPDYISGIKRAAAIVTNEGGVTCHAAIVSRELGIPCVIGTKIATRVLRDGDEVEVDAEKGIIRKL